MTPSIPFVAPYLHSNPQPYALSSVISRRSRRSGSPVVKRFGNGWSVKIRRRPGRERRPTLQGAVIEEGLTSVLPPDRQAVVALRATALPLATADTPTKSE